MFKGVGVKIVAVLVGLLWVGNALATDDLAKLLSKNLADEDLSTDYTITLTVPETGERFETTGKMGDIT